MIVERKINYNDMANVSVKTMPAKAHPFKAKDSVKHIDLAVWKPYKNRPYFFKGTLTKILCLF